MFTRPAARPLVMGIVNVTPDSFSDGGLYLRTEDAVTHGEQLAGEGADVVDVGGESTRPGAAPVGEEEELARVLPVVGALAGSVPVSVDTTKPAVARAAVEVGATLLNDVSGRLWPLAAQLGVGWVSMHRRGTPATMQRLTGYEDVVAEVREHVVAAAVEALQAGVPRVWLDPGIGFAKTSQQNLELLAALPELVAAAGALGPEVEVLVGTSRKGFLGTIGAQGPGPVPPADRLEASLATAVWCMAAGAGMVRVHDVAATVQAAAVVGTAPPEGAP